MSVDLDQWEKSGEAVFRTDEADAPPTRSVPVLLGLGGLFGLLSWAAVDRDLSWLHVSCWMASGMMLAMTTLLPSFKRSLLKTIRVTRDGFTVVRHGGSEASFWRDLEAGCFQDYPIVNLGTQVRCFRYRTRGKNFEVQIGGFEDDTSAAFRAVVLSCLEAHGIPEHTAAMPSFQHSLSRAGAWIFALSGFGILVGHSLAYHTLGTVFGFGFMATGVCIAFITRKERTSRVVLTGSAVLMLGSIAIVQALHVSVRDTLNDWEQLERRLGRPPWSVPSEDEGAQQKIAPPPAQQAPR